MTPNKKAITIFKLWLPVIIWCGVIYFFSDQPYLKSDLSSETDLALRKLTHIAEYAILTFLLFRAYFRSNGFSKKKSVSSAIIFALIYSLTDEYHQTFVPGREGCLRDIVIDSLGIFATGLFLSKNYVKNKNFRSLYNFISRKKPTALLLFSGGLDSILVLKLLEEQNIKVIPLYFKSVFINNDVENENFRFLPHLEIINFSKKQLEIIKNPRYGYGKNLNPCIDCHLAMLKEAKKIMKEKGCDFIATGEVLGERPMSQNKASLELVERKSSLEGFLLRPLSAKLLEPTAAEKVGLIKRDKFLAIRGRGRSEQMALAKKYKVTKFPSPAGGCLLTDTAFSERLKKLLKKKPDPTLSDLKLLKLGRHFWQENVLIVVGRNDEENKKIKKTAQENDILMELKNFTGPLTLVRGENILNETIKKAQQLTAHYSTKAREKKDLEFVIHS